MTSLWFGCCHIEKCRKLESHLDRVKPHDPLFPIASGGRLTTLFVYELIDRRQKLLRRLRLYKRHNPILEDENKQSETVRIRSALGSVRSPPNWFGGASQPGSGGAPIP